ncbi:MAG TPA: hypothetical protein VFM99_07255, partial [Chitinophagales bacterium]|nr:hypothetical protein [Chitinophagales bacterium]
LIFKDDMVAPANVSKQIEEIRKTDRYYLSSKVIMMGSLITVGDHLYINRKSPNWKEAALELIRIMNDEKQISGASMVQFRDLNSLDTEISDFLIAEGFIKVEMPDAHTLENLNWETETEYLSSFSSGSRWHFKKMISSKKVYFNVAILEGEDKKRKGNVNDWYKLYSNVKEKSYNINTYELPVKYFSNMIDHPNWEIIEIRLKHEFDERKEKDQLVSVAFCYRSSRNNYSMMAVGMDYDYVLTHGSYRQILYQSVLRANYLKCNKLYLGMDAAVEKRRLGVKVIPSSAYLQADDNFNMELMGIVYTK